MSTVVGGSIAAIVVAMSVMGIFRQLTAWIALKLLTFIDLRDL